MVETLHAAPGVGLAAPQVDVGKRLIVVDLSVGEDKDALHVLINPEIVVQGRRGRLRGGLPLGPRHHGKGRPALPGRRPRARPRGRATVEIEGEDLLARALCHEIDHLDGILFVDKLSSLKRALIKKKLKKSVAAAKTA